MNQPAGPALQKPRSFEVQPFRWEQGKSWKLNHPWSGFDLQYSDIHIDRLKQYHWKKTSWWKRAFDIHQNLLPSRLQKSTGYFLTQKIRLTSWYGISLMSFFKWLTGYTVTEWLSQPFGIHPRAEVPHAIVQVHDESNSLVPLESSIPTSTDASGFLFVCRCWRKNRGSFVGTSWCLKKRCHKNKRLVLKARVYWTNG